MTSAWGSGNVRAVVRHALQAAGFSIKPWHPGAWTELETKTAPPVRMTARSADGEVFLITVQRVVKEALS